MRIIARSTIRNFWERFPNAENPLKVWFGEVKKGGWEDFNQLKAQFGNASVVGNDRVIFNIKGNDYRLVAAIDYEKQIVWIRFIGSHKEYDKINAKTI
jgi:mRNA interferase HigB